MRFSASLGLTLLSAVVALFVCAWLISASPIRAQAQNGRSDMGVGEVLGMMFRAPGKNVSRLATTRSLVSHATRSLVVFAAAVILGVLVGTPLGLHRTLSAARRRVMPRIPVLSLPVSIISVVLATVLAYRANVFPVSGFESVPPLAGGLRRAWDVLKHVALPALVLMLGDGNLRDFSGFAGATARREVDRGFVELAGGLGVSRTRIIWKYLLRSALSGVVDGIRVRLPLLLGGTIVVESIFTINGIGYLFVHSIETNNVYVLARVTLWFVLLTACLSVLADTLVRVRRPPGINNGGQSGGV